MLLTSKNSNDFLSQTKIENEFKMLNVFFLVKMLVLENKQYWTERSCKTQ